MTRKSVRPQATPSSDSEPHGCAHPARSLDPTPREQLEGLLLDNSTHIEQHIAAVAEANAEIERLSPLAQSGDETAALKIQTITEAKVRWQSEREILDKERAIIAARL